MSYIGAPYNFVPFSNTVRHYDQKSLPGHGSVVFKNTEGTEELISGIISYEITAKTDIFIGSGKKNGNGLTESFYQNARGNYAIPGSTIRGLIRNNAQILSLSEIGEDIDDYALMYRNVAGGSKKQKKRYGDILGAKAVPIIDKNGKKNSISVLEKVNAGYISCSNGLYTIDDLAEPAPKIKEQKTNYYILSERTVIHDYLDAAPPERPCAYPLFFPGGKSILQHDNKKDFKSDKRNGKEHYVNDKNKDYKPYVIPCSYNVSGRAVTGVDVSGKLDHEGFAVSTGKMNEHKAVYIIPARKKTYDESETVFPIKVRPEDIEAFRTDLKNRETTLKQFGGREHFDLPEEGKTRPVFYIREGERLYFGFTPRLRLFYDHTISEGIPAEHKKGELDYAKALFGYSADNDAYKSRVSFSDAVMKNGKKPGETVNAILSEPKPTSYLDYLEQTDQDEMSYNDPGFKLRGVKQYWLRDKAYSEVPSEKQSKEYVLKFAPLPQETKFVGKVRFKNLKQEELGLLLWSISLNGTSEMNIGKAKAYGFGRIIMNITDAVRMDHAKAYAMSELELYPWEKLDVTELVGIYKEQFKKSMGIRPEQEASIKILLGMKDPLAKPDDDKIKYMDIDKKEYQNRKEPLQSALELIKIVKSEVKEDESYKAEITKIEGKNIRFRALEIENIYGKFSIEDIICREVSRKELKTLLSKGDVIEVRKKEKDKGEGWVCVKLPEKA